MDLVLTNTLANRLVINIHDNCYGHDIVSMETEAFHQTPEQLPYTIRQSDLFPLEMICGGTISLFIIHLSNAALKCLSLS